ncbi:hypothetical protein SGPA1_41025 [Streptomyces misionensis JCM 4497]
MAAHRDRRRRHHRCRDLHARRHGGQRHGRPRGAGVLPDRGRGERVRGTVLRRVRGADPEGWLGVHLRLRGARRVRGLVHRLGPAARVHGDRGGRRDRHLRLLRLPRRTDGGEAAALDDGRARHRLRAPGGPVRGGALPADRLAAHPGHPQRGPLRDAGGRGEGAGGAAGDRGGLLPHRHGELPPVLPLRRRRRLHGRGDGVLRGVRLRRHVDGGRGVQGRAAAHAEGDHLLAGDRDGAVRGGLPGADGHAELPAHRQGERVLHGVQVGGPERARERDRGGRHHRHPHGDVHLHAGGDPGVVLHVPGRSAAQVVRQDAPDAARADPGDLDRRGGLGADRRVPADRRGGRADQHRHPAGVRGGLHGGDRAALPAPRPAPHLPHPGGAVRARAGRALLALADHVPPVADVGAVRGVVPDRLRRLLRLLVQAFRAGRAAARVITPPSPGRPWRRPG